MGPISLLPFAAARQSDAACRLLDSASRRFEHLSPDPKLLVAATR